MWWKFFYYEAKQSKWFSLCVSLCICVFMQWDGKFSFFINYAKLQFRYVLVTQFFICRLGNITLFFCIAWLCCISCCSFIIVRSFCLGSLVVHLLLSLICLRVLVWCLSIARSSDTNWILINCYRINYLYLNVIICWISMINFFCKNTALFISSKKRKLFAFVRFFYYLLPYLIFLYTPSIKKKTILFCPLTTLTDFARF